VGVTSFFASLPLYYTRDKPARLISPAESKRFANRGETPLRSSKQIDSRERLEKTSPQDRQFARESSKPERIERGSFRTENRVQSRVAEVNKRSEVRSARSEKTQRQVSRVERSISKGTSYKH